MAKKEFNLTSILEKYSAEKEDEMVPTGVLPVDDLLGGGINPGSMYAFWGTAGSGKSTIALQICKAFIKKGDKIVWIDTEKALNKNQQISFGVREYVENGTFIHVTADNYAQAGELCHAIAMEKDSGIKLVVIDSETQLLPKTGDEGVEAITSLQPGTKSRQASTFLTLIKGEFYEAGIASLILSHARANLNMQSLYGPKEAMAGGYALKHVPDAILQILPGQKIGDDKLAPTGVTLHLQCDKSKFSVPFRRIDADLTYGKGILKKPYLVQWGINSGTIQKNGSFFNVDGESIRGTDALMQMDNSKFKWLQDKYDEYLKSQKS